MALMLELMGGIQVITVQGSNFKRFRENGKEFQMVWDVNSVASPEGATVVVVDFSRPAGQREIFRKIGMEHELGQLQWEAEEVIKQAAG
jgi:hypothetical protein